MKEFLDKYFDKLLLATLFVVMVGVVLYTESVKNDDTVNWAREQTSLIEGGLLGLCTGMAIGKSLRTQPEPPASPQEPKP